MTDKNKDEISFGFSKDSIVVESLFRASFVLDVHDFFDTFECVDIIDKTIDDDEGKAYATAIFENDVITVVVLCFADLQEDVEVEDLVFQPYMFSIIGAVSKDLPEIKGLDNEKEGGILC